MNRKILSLITAGVLSAAVLTGCGKEKSEKDSVKIAYLPITHSLAVLEEAEELWDDSICCGLVLTDSFIENRTEDAKSFTEIYKAAGNNLDKETAKATAKKYFKQNDEVLETSLQWISFDNLEITEDTYNALTDKVKKYGLSDNPPAYSDFVKNDF